MTDDTLPMTDERAAFEAWWKGDLVDWRGHQSVPALHAWAAWQARAALASPAAPHPAQQAGDMVVVSRGALAMVRNALQRDADEGRQIRAEMLRALDEATVAAAPAIPAQQAGQPEDAAKDTGGNGMRFQWCCGNGCGPCDVQRTEYEYERVETLDGELVSSKTEPMLVSACCGAKLFMWDIKREQEVHLQVDSGWLFSATAMSSPTAKKGE